MRSSSSPVTRVAKKLESSGCIHPKVALVQPFLKWAGGKRQLLPDILPLIPKGFNRYFEPFVGGGAVLFALQPQVATINDPNLELINCYQTIKNHPQALIQLASTYKNDSDAYYQVRELDRSAAFQSLSSLERAARLLYLNKTCYNGLFRVNRQGQFNVPFGSYKNPIIADPEVIHAISTYLNQADILYLNGDFARAVQQATRGDFVYFDPPYDPVSETASFTSYSLNGFDREQQVRLQQTCDALTERGVKWLLSNSDTPFIRRLGAVSMPWQKDAAKLTSC
jgi:DNA adenine methylase